MLACFNYQRGRERKPAHGYLCLLLIISVLVITSTACSNSNCQVRPMLYSFLSLPIKQMRSVQIYTFFSCSEFESMRIITALRIMFFPNRLCSWSLLWQLPFNGENSTHLYQRPSYHTYFNCMLCSFRSFTPFVSYDMN